MNYGDYLYCGHYVSGVFDDNTVIWWNCDDFNITEISDFPEGVFTREIRKLTTKKGKLMSGSKDTLFVVYIRTRHLIASGSVLFKN